MEETENDERYRCEILPASDGERCRVLVTETESEDTFTLDFAGYQYAESSPHNAYVAAVDLAQRKLLWKTRPSISNSSDFAIRGDVLLCGYGFTAEPDYLYQLDLASGQVIAELPLASKADYLIIKDDSLYVRTHNTDYTFGIE